MEIKKSSPDIKFPKYRCPFLTRTQLISIPPQLTKRQWASFYPLRIIFLLFVIAIVNGGFVGAMAAPVHTVFADITITGKVTDDKGSPIAGATVRLKGTRYATTTDSSGSFSLTIPTDTEVLEISCIGYTPQQISVNHQKKVTVRLLQTQDNLGEVVVVGYGTQKKATLTGAVSQIKGDVIKLSPNGNLSNNLTGRMPGLIAVNRTGEPGNDGSSLSIRGAGSFSNPNAGPLIIVDGIPDRSFSRLNPDDIESVSVLKDASAAIYGMRAANGVVLITTKRGKSGKPTVNYNGSFGLQSVTRKLNLVNASQYATYINEMNTRLGQPKTYTDEDVKLYADGSDPLGHPSTDWWDAVIRKTAPQTQHDLSISGGSDNVKYFVSGQYQRVDYLYKGGSGFNFNQKNIRANLDINVTKDLKVSLDLAGRNEEKYGPLSNASQNGGIFMYILGQYPTLAAQYANGYYGIGNTVGSNPLINATDIPGNSRNLSYFIQPVGTIDLKMPWITPGLSFNAYAALDNTYWQYKNLTRPYDVYQYNKDTKEYVNFRDQTAGNGVTLNETWGRWRRNTYNFKLSYDRNFENIHAINALIGYEQSDYFTENIGVTRRNLLSDQLPFIGMGGSDPANLGNSGTGDQNGRKSVYGRINYGYANKYLVEFSGRYNGSYNFAPGRQWGFFPGISAGWVLSQEKFWSKISSIVNFAKIKGSWGILGYDEINPYLFLGLYNLVDPGSFFGPEGTPVPGLTTGVSPLQSFTWEKVKSTDIGIETALFNSRLTINADYFYRKRYDILTARNASVPNYTGLSGKLPPENIGKANSYGFELELNYNGNIGKYFTYNIGGNYTHTDNKIIFMDESPNVPAYQKQTGFPIQSLLMYKTDGIYNNQQEIDAYTNTKGQKVIPLTGTKPGDIKYVDVNNDGKITSLDQVRYYQNPVPRDVFGITLGMKYKGFGLSALLYGQSNAYQIIRPQGTNAAFTPPLWEYEGRWTPETPDNNKPAAFDRTSTINNLNSDFWLNDMRFLKLKTLELSYDLPADFISTIKLKRARVFINGSNLFTWSKIKEYDPELNYVPSDNNGYYVNAAYYPQTRIINAGFNLTF
ncbi:SusC/RagA family TonB-linked outer membrane protein [Chitinophaga sp. RAB17]|uniref:SusC/RagA family TonB-linked outer membrane protein n=1 Tax=Chitinophaga sp. RAB17 TaxID=3233049 RepID=UPI003F90D765